LPSILSTDTIQKQVDDGLEYKLDVELEDASSINLPTTEIPANAYVPARVNPAWARCTPTNYLPEHPSALWPLLSAECQLWPPFAPVHYSL